MSTMLGLAAIRAGGIPYAMAASFDVCFWRILLQKSAYRGRGTADAIF
jgi:hypothetical protein